MTSGSAVTRKGCAPVLNRRASWTASPRRPHRLTHSHAGCWSRPACPNPSGLLIPQNIVAVRRVSHARSCPTRLRRSEVTAPSRHAWCDVFVVQPRRTSRPASRPWPVRPARLVQRGRRRQRGGDAAVRVDHDAHPGGVHLPYPRRLFISVTCSGVIPSLAGRPAAFGVGTKVQPVLGGCCRFGFPGFRTLLLAELVYGTPVQAG